MIDGIHKYRLGKSLQTSLCNGIIKQTYASGYCFIPIIDGGGNRHIVGFFQDDSVTFYGCNSDTFKFAFENKLYKFYLLNMFGPYLDFVEKPKYSSPDFKDIPLLAIEKGRVATFSLIDHGEEGYPILFFPSYKVEDYHVPMGVSVNYMTGDISVNANLMDTGYYSVRLDAHETIGKDITRDRTETFYNFTIKIVNEHIPYFTNTMSYNRDSLLIPYIKISPIDKTVNYQCDYIVPKGLGNYMLNFQTPLNFNKSPEISGTKINDSTLHINMTVYMDTGFYKVYEHLPQSMSLIVTTTDSSGNCNDDMTSFYITRDKLSGMDKIVKDLNISIYPNPVSKDITVSAPENIFIDQITLTDVIGRESQMNYKKVNDKYVLDVSEFREGIYFLMVTTDSGTIYKKVIKER